MIDFFADNFANCVALAVLLVAMIPTLESKIAIPFGMSMAIWGEQVLSPLAAFFVSFAGCMIPSIFVILFARFVKSKTSGFIQEKFMTRYKSGVEKANSKASVFGKCAWVTLFVAIPLPLTGTYSGSFIAGLLNIKIWQAFLAVAVGAAISCGIVLALCLLFVNSTFYIFIVSLVLVAVWLVVSFVLWLCKRIKANKQANLL